MAVLAEAGRVSLSLAAPLCLIHADEFAPEKEERFRSALRDLQMDSGNAIRFEPGEPAESILKVQREENIDLLVAGAMETESVHRNFTGDVARELLKRAPCDLLLFTEPNENPKPPEGIIVVVPDLSEPSRRVLRSALDLAQRGGGHRQIITLLHVQTTFAQAKEKALGVNNGTLSTEETLQSWVEVEARPGMELDYHLLRGNTGFTACEFIQSSGTDLVVMPSQMPSPDQTVFAPALDWIIQVIPGNLWVIRQEI